VSAEPARVDYSVVHTTRYDYSEAVSVSHHVARLTPRTNAHQVCHQHRIDVEPDATVMKMHFDYFGNPMTFFATQVAHRRLTVRATSRVTATTVSLSAAETPRWEAATDRASLPLEAIDCVLEPRPNRTNAEATAYARESFPAARPLLEAVADLTQRIHRDFTYDPKATTVATPLAEVFETRRGVCQDFARLEIACLRAMGVPARYVSGYLETSQPSGKPRLVGTAASHAWVSVFCPGPGWVDVDPTNNLMPANSHVTLAWGRDYSDISPIRGVILGGGGHSLQVSVEVARIEPDD
jgi:transglutaminase-like putative cysteine protease